MSTVNPVSLLKGDHPAPKEGFVAIIAKEDGSLVTRDGAGAEEPLAAASGGLSGSPETYTESNVTTDRAFNANSMTLDEIADVLGSLIVDLRARGVVA